MAQSGHIQAIYNTRKNILEHLKYQNFDTSNFNEFSINEIYNMYQNKQLDMLLTRSANTSKNIKEKKVMVKYHISKSLKPNDIYGYLEEIFNIEKTLSKDDDLILVCGKEEPNETTIKTLKQIWSLNKINIIIWNIKLLQFNILEHILVPKHIVLSPTEDAEFRKRYNIQNDSELPDISRFSNVAMAIGLRPGQICKIIRPSKTAITSEFYRICSP
jgi:DNA-directed RNA polymerase subunit H (RpoH/RPB5)